MFTFQVKKLQFLTDNLLQVFLLPATKSLRYQAGQYVEILYPDGTYAPFSIANAPDDSGGIELHIRVMSNDIALQTWIKQLQRNGEVVLRGPYGNAFYRATPNNPIILLAGGTGFAYAKAIIEQAIIEKDQRKIHLYWNVKEAADFYLPELPDIWQKKLPYFQYTLIVSKAKDTTWRGKTGYAKDVVVKGYPDLSTMQIYASGPFAMINSAYQVFQKHGLHTELMYSDML